MAFPVENILDKGSAGNYWSDYNGTDSDGNSISDTPYIINENDQDVMNPNNTREPNSLFGSIRRLIADDC